MHSSLQRVNHLSSLATTYLMILFASIAATSFFALPTIQPGSIEVRDLILKRGRVNRWSAREEEFASLKFDLRTDLQPVLDSYNTKQLFLYLTASFDEAPGSTSHQVVLWDRIIQRADIRDIRAVGHRVPKTKGSKRGRGNLRVEAGRNQYHWRMPAGSFKHVDSANLTLHYSLMPYVGVLHSGIAAVAHGPVTIPEVKQR